MNIVLIIERIDFLPEPNVSGAIYGPTAGISRNMQWELGPGDVVNFAAGAPGTGGGDLNGSANTANLLGQAGTAGVRIAVPRKPPNPGNYCGII
jgi:hypothetical protein